MFGLLKYNTNNKKKLVIESTLKRRDQFLYQFISIITRTIYCDANIYGLI